MFARIIEASEFNLSVEKTALIKAVSMVENQAGDPEAVGDKHLEHKAYGLLQIRQMYLDDANRFAGKKVFQKWGVDKLTLQDMKDKEKAEWVFTIYLSYYGNVYTKKTGKKPTVKVYARIHNGGPNGWKKDSTLAFAEKVLENFKNS